MNLPSARCCRAAISRGTLSPLRLAFFAALLPVMAATTHAATVSGRITNQATGYLLPGAVVQVEGTSISAIAERGGTYAIEVPAGAQTLIVNYSGLDATRVPLNVGSANLVKDIELTSGIYKLDAFSVSGVREGSALAIQTQRQSENPKWVAATDTFGNPAANPGELIQRLPGISTDIVGSEVRTLYVRGMGPGFSSLMVDGDRVATSTGTSGSRDYQIEQMGTGNLETVELIKAPQPEQDANAVAGFVNLVSRRAFDAPGRRVTLTGGVMWRLRSFDETPFKDRPDDLDILSLAYSDVFNVFGGRKNLGIAFNANRRVSATTQDEIGPGGVLYNFAQTYLNPTGADPLTRVFGTGDFGYKARAHNAGLSIDYKLTPDAFVYLKLSFNTNDQYQVYYRPGIGNPAATAANFAPGSTYEHSFLLPHAGSVAISESTPAFTKNSRNYGFSGGTEFKLFQRSATVALRASYSHADISYPGWVRAQARTPATAAAGIGFEIDRRGQDPWYPIFRQTHGPSISDPANYNMTSYQKQSYKAGNDLYGLRADLTKRFDTTRPITVKAGVKWADDSRNPWTDLGVYTFVGADGLANSGDESMKPYADLIYKQGDGRYGPFPIMTAPQNIPAAYLKQTAANVYTSYTGTMAGRVKFNEEISAAYAQASTKLGRLRILGGVRIEQTETEGRSWVRNTTATWGGNNVGGASLDPAVVAANLGRAQRSFARPITAEGSYRNVFPGLHFVYNATDSLLLRASYNRAISRPPVASIIPTLTENLDGLTVSMGNPDLKPYLSDNFEISAEKYFEPVGLFSVGAFQKNISDYFRTFASTVPAEGIDGQGQYAGYTLSIARNIGSAKIRGIELSYQQQFSFLPGVWKGLGAFANFTYLEAEGDFGTAATTNRLGNLAPRSGNAGLNFRARGLDLRLLSNWTAQKYKSTLSGINVYAEERLTFDVKVQYAINRRYSIFLDCVNITDEAPRTDVALNGLKFFRTNQGVSFAAGVRGQF